MDRLDPLWIGYLGLAALFTVAELIRPARKLRYRNGNYGALFSIWDRLFGTYLDPDTTVPRKFGTGEPRRDPVLLVLGV